jgi:hypothetical protein
MAAGGRRVILRAAVLFGVTVLTAGCSYLLGVPPGGEFPEPSTVATYTGGRATIAIKGGETLVLDRLAAPGTLVTTFGGEVTWRNDDGWYVKLQGLTPRGSSSTPFPMGAEFLQFDRIVDGAHWTTFQFSPSCALDIDQADAKGVRGSATCHGLRWSDAIAGMSMTAQPTYVEGEAPFDAEITFEAAPAQ